MEHPDLRRSVAAAAGIAVLLGLGIGGGALFAGTGTSATPGNAWPFALVGAVLGITAVSVAVALVRRLFPAAWTALRSSLLIAAAIGFAVGALLGAGLAPNSVETDDAVADPELQTDDPTTDPSGGGGTDDRNDEVGEGGDGQVGDGASGQVGQGGTGPASVADGGGTVGSDVSVVGVDANSDGEIDTDADGQPILGVDQNGDGLVDAILIPCATDSMNERPEPGTVLLDQNCDGTADFTLRFDGETLLGASPRVAAQLEHFEALGLGLDDLDLDELGEELDWLDESDLTAEDLEDLGLDAKQNPEQIDQGDTRGNDDEQTIRWGTLIGLLFVGLLVLSAIAALCLLIVALVRGTFRRGETPSPPLHVPIPEGDEEPLDLGPAIASSLDTLELELDPRAGICAAYGTLLDRLAESGLARRPEEAPEEHVLRCLDGASLPERPVRELLDLFTIARFSTHPVTEHHRQAAVAAMREVLAATNGPAASEPPVLAGPPAAWAPPTGVHR